ncbi:hypothetical protein LUZ61_012538 [Rhynchospora tenuis]|uniref:Retrotransposon gag domain-containing protein n=1 Tax=Rhynchospora tenuis TaxID=198213 RepID=A0AAD6A3I9_9POAL|nr:hypothetical protein LUZ61_012538 [Rhynchospora tenuis]
MGPSRTTKHSKRHRHHHHNRRSSPPSPSIDKAFSENKSDDEQPATSPLPSEDNPNDFAYDSNNAPYTTLDYIPVAPLPIFSGEPDECPFAHLFRFDCICRVNNADSEDLAAHIFPASLNSYAGLWYDMFIDPSLPWEEIRSAFLSAFQPPDFSNRSRTELVSLYQSGNETVTRYHLRMLWILKKWPEHGMGEDILKGIFIDGLREELKEQVAPQRPVTLDEAVLLAASWEQAVDIREAQKKALKMVKCDFCGVEGHELNACEMRQRMKALWMSKATGSLPRIEGESETGNAKALVALKRLDSTRSSVQCQCQKHQCQKKGEDE